MPLDTCRTLLEKLATPAIPLPFSSLKSLENKGLKNKYLKNKDLMNIKAECQKFRKEERGGKNFFDAYPKL